MDEEGVGVADDSERVGVGERSVDIVEELESRVHGG
jgi:hypothetical protein